MKIAICLILWVLCQQPEDGIAILFSFHNLNKSEHLVGAFIGVVVVFARHFVIGDEIFAPELIDLKAAFVDVKMYVALFKIGRAGLPYLRFGVERFDRKPRAVADALRVLLGIGKKDLKVIVIRFLVDLQDHAADASALVNDAVGLVFGVVDATLDRLARNDLSVKIKVIVALAEFDQGAVLKGPLVVKNELLAVIRGEGNESYFSFFHISSKKDSSGIAKAITRAHSDT